MIKGFLFFCILSISFSLISSQIISCDINCVASGQCNCLRGTFVCPANRPCVVSCPNYNSCIYSSIDASKASSLTLLCNGQQSCQETKVFCPQNSGSCSISCPSYDSCYKMYVSASLTTGPFNLSCTAQGACQEVQIQSSGNSVNINCSQYDSCYSSIFNFGSSSALSLSCSAQGACQQVQLTCPTSGPCFTSCTEYDSCYAMQFLAAQSSQLSVQCLATASCQSATFQCPSSLNGANGGLCTIYCPSSYSCYGSNINSNSANSYLCLECGGSQSCQSANALIGRAASITCNGYYSCYGTNFNANQLTASNLNLSCGSQSCQAASVSCQSADYTSVTCQQSQSCPNVACTGRSNTPSVLFNFCPGNLANPTYIPVTSPQASTVTPPICYCPCACDSNPQECRNTLFSDVTVPQYCVGDIAYVINNLTALANGNQLAILQTLMIIGDLLVSSGGVLRFTISNTSNPQIIIIGGVTLDGAEIIIEITKDIDRIEEIQLITIGGVGNSDISPKLGQASDFNYKLTVSNPDGQSYITTLVPNQKGLMVRVENTTPSQDGASATASGSCSRSFLYGYL